MSEQKSIIWSAAKLKRFEAAYEEALITLHDPKNDVFEFEDNFFILSYASYLIEYLKTLELK